MWFIVQSDECGCYLLRLLQDHLPHSSAAHHPLADAGGPQEADHEGHVGKVTRTATPEARG